LYHTFFRIARAFSKKIPDFYDFFRIVDFDKKQVPGAEKVGKPGILSPRVAAGLRFLRPIM